MKTAVLVDDTNMSDLNYHVMSELNDVVGGDHDSFLLTSNVSSKVIKTDFAVINSSRVNCVYDGLVVATSVSTAKLLAKAAINSKKVWYLYKLDWLETLFDFNELYDLINNPKLILICRSDNHMNIIQKVFGRRPEYKIPNFKLDEIWTSLENTKTF